jgi:hypothetical protein
MLAGTLSDVSPRSRAIVIGLGVTAVVLVVVLIAVALTSGGGHSKVAITSSTIGAATTTAPTSTTVVLLPVIPSTAPTSAVPTTTTSSTVAPTTTLPPLVNGSGAVLAAPAATDQRAESGGCASLADPGWGGVRCGVAHGKPATLTWLTESRTGPGSEMATRSYVFSPTTATNERVVLEAFDNGGTRFSGVQAKVDTVEGGGFEDIVFGFRNQGTAQILSVDLVQGRGEVTVHQDLYRGVARTAPGRLDAWSAVLAASDPNCCPSSYEHETISYSDGGWRVVVAETVAPNAVPPSQL